MSGVRLTRGYMKGMLERNWGRIIFLSSESGVNIPDDMLHYGFTKTAVLALSRGLAKLARGPGVTANAVLPGPTMPAGVERMLPSGLTSEQARRGGRLHRLRHLAADRRNGRTSRRRAGSRRKRSRPPANGG